MSRDRDLMRAHIDALFTHDADGRLLRVNEPNGALAPRFFLGRTVDGAALRLRHDVDDALRHELKTAAYDEIFSDYPVDSPIDATRYAEILSRSAPVEKSSTGPAFCFPDELPTALETIAVTDANADALHLHLPEWMPDVRLSQPMVALLVDGHAVAVCCSVRRADTAHEAGVETAPAFADVGTRRRSSRDGQGQCGTWIAFPCTARRGRMRRHAPSRANSAWFSSAATCTSPEVTRL